MGYQLMKMLTEEDREVIEWAGGRIKVHAPQGLADHVLHKYFRHSKYASFQRQLNYFGFRKIPGKGKMSPCSYVNDAATDDMRSILFIKRKTNGSAARQKSNVAASVATAKKTVTVSKESVTVSKKIQNRNDRNDKSAEVIPTSLLPDDLKQSLQQINYSDVKGKNLMLLNEITTSSLSSKSNSQNMNNLQPDFTNRQQGDIQNQSSIPDTIKQKNNQHQKQRNVSEQLHFPSENALAALTRPQRVLSHISVDSSINSESALHTVSPAILNGSSKAEFKVGKFNSTSIVSLSSLLNETMASESKVLFQSDNSIDKSIAKAQGIQQSQLSELHEELDIENNNLSKLASLPSLKSIFAEYVSPSASSQFFQSSSSLQQLYDSQYSLSRNSSLVDLAMLPTISNPSLSSFTKIDASENNSNSTYVSDYGEIMSEAQNGYMIG